MSSRLKVCFSFKRNGICSIPNCLYFHPSPDSLAATSRALPPLSRGPSSTRPSGVSGTSHPPLPPLPLSTNHPTFPPLDSVTSLSSDKLLYPENPLFVAKVRAAVHRYSVKGLLNQQDLVEYVRALMSLNENGALFPKERQQLVVQFMKMTTRFDEALCLVPKANFAVFLGLIGFLTSETVRTSPEHLLRALYMKIDFRLVNILTALSNGLTDMFKPIILFLFQYLRFHPNSLFHSRTLSQFITLSLPQFFTQWKSSLFHSNSWCQLRRRTKEDQIYFLHSVERDVTRLTEFATGLMVVGATPVGWSEGYDGPGEISTSGRRHDNDHKDITTIAITPTSAEITSSRDEYIPTIEQGAPYHLPSNSVAKLLDIQFRLFRIDALSEFARGVRCILEELRSGKNDTAIARSLQNETGWYDLRSDDIRLPILTGLRIVDVRVNSGAELVVEATPPMHKSARASAFNTRYGFWMNAQRLPRGGLVAVITKRPGEQPMAQVATLTRMPMDFKHPVRYGFPVVQFGLTFSTLDENLRSLTSNDPSSLCFLVENPVLWPSVVPFLECLKSIPPYQMPLGSYISSSSPSHRPIELPAYSRAPNFVWDMTRLLKKESGRGSFHFKPSSETSVLWAREVLKEDSILDPSQAEAVMDALTREMALMQGPPGTGKTFTGVQLLGVLHDNNVGKIIMMAQTNHALDHMLLAVLRSVTPRFVRLGTGSKDETIKGYELGVLNQVVKSPYGRARSFARHKMQQIEKELLPLLKSIQSPKPRPDEHERYVRFHYPYLWASLHRAPEYILAIRQSTLKQAAQAADEGFVTVPSPSTSSATDTLWGFWESGVDLAHLEQLSAAKRVHMGMKQEVPTLEEVVNRFATLELQVDGEVENNPVSGKWQYLFTPSADEEIDLESPDSTRGSEDTPITPPSPPSIDQALSDPTAFVEYFKLPALPTVAKTTRRVEELVAGTEGGEVRVWEWSLKERQAVARWLDKLVKQEMDPVYSGKVNGLWKEYEEAIGEWKEAKNNLDWSLLQNARILGATTNGMAKYAEVIKRLGPTVMVVEEAGQVLEAHTLASLFPSIQHVISIGDPLQLRPIPNRHEFSVDSPNGAAKYRFDVSLMERLSDSGLAMSQLQVQRRMRPQISSLVRSTLYPKLEDHDCVQNYPHVSGMHKDVFFLNHSNHESGGDKEGTSKTNAFELDFCPALAEYLMKQGCYDDEGDIVILCAYGGQLASMRRLLSTKFDVVMDDRDLTKFGRKMDGITDDTPGSGGMKRVLLRSIDNFQGEEAKVVIISLVRNDGSVEDSAARQTIGFLKTRNRTNVALSRAKHGMYILGNADQLSVRSDMWRTIVSEMRDAGSVGRAIPIACKNHPEEIRMVARYEEFKKLAPDGGCLRDCEAKLPKCHHRCGKKCHPDDPDHATYVCPKPCERERACGHACARICGMFCGPCEVKVDGVRLPCGHEARVVCHQRDHLEGLVCQTLVLKQLPTCEHKALVPCNDVGSVMCTAVCGGDLGCGHICKRTCYECQQATIAVTTAKVKAAEGLVRGTGTAGTGEATKLANLRPSLRQGRLVAKLP